MAAIRGIGLGFIVEFKELKIIQIPEKCQPGAVYCIYEIVLNGD
jgi:hypothetical protein